MKKLLFFLFLWPAFAVFGQQTAVNYDSLKCRKGHHQVGFRFNAGYGFTSEGLQLTDNYRGGSYGLMPSYHYFFAPKTSVGVALEWHYAQGKNKVDNILGRRNTLTGNLAVRRYFTRRNALFIELNYHSGSALVYRERLTDETVLTDKHFILSAVGLGGGLDIVPRWARKRQLPVTFQLSFYMNRSLNGVNWYTEDIPFALRAHFGVNYHF